MAELYQRPGSPYWYAVLRDPRAADGIVRRSTKARHKPEARKAAELAQKEIDAEVAAANALAHEEAQHCGLTWLDAVTLFVEGNTAVKDSTADSYNNISQVVERILGDFDLATLDQAKIRQFCQDRRKMTVKPHKARDTGRPISDQTIRNNLSAMSSIIQYAIDHDRAGDLKINPLRNFDRKFLKTSKRVDRHLRPNQFQDVLDACQSDLHRRMLMCLVGTGMRVSEVTNLYWAEVDLEKKVIEFGNIDPDRTKSARSRRIPVLDPVHIALLAQRDAQIATKTYHHRGLVFPSPRTSGPRTDLKYLTRIARERAGVKGFWVHGLRHTFASWSLQGGLDPETIRKVLGHTTLSTTSRYAHHVPDSVMARVRTLELPIAAQNVAQTIGFSSGTNIAKEELPTHSEA